VAEEGGEEEEEEEVVVVGEGTSLLQPGKGWGSM